MRISYMLLLNDPEVTAQERQEGLDFLTKPAGMVAGEALRVRIEETRELIAQRRREGRNLEKGAGA